MGNINLRIELNTRQLKQLYQRLEKIVYDGIPKFAVEELDSNLHMNVPVVTGQLKRSIKLFKRDIKDGRLADLSMMWYGIPVNERRGWIDTSVKETLDYGESIARQSIAFGFGGMLG